MSERVPEGWRYNSIAECCEILDSQRIPLNSEERSKRFGEYPYYGANGIQGYVDDFIFDGDAILVAEDGGNFDQYAERPIAQWVTGKYWVNNHAHILRAKENDLDKWIFYSLVHKNILRFINGGTRAKLNQSDLREIQLYLPPLPEQKKIASILTSVDEVIETTQKQIDKLQDLKKATMNELLTKGIGHTEFKDSELGRIPKSWEVKEIGKLGDIVTGSTPSTTNRDLYDGNYMFVSPADISDGMFISKTGKKLSLAGLNKTRKIPEKSVMVVCIGSTIGKVAISTQECASNQQINSIVPKENDAYFVYFAMKWMAHLIKKEAGTQAVPLINKTEFSNLFVPVPPRDEQMKIGKALHSINVGIDKLNAKLSQIQSLKKSLMQDLLTGKVRVQVN
ncbi:restriction endonuclease subunit S [Planktomarina temperata]|nr:restriction endonuclease subunit S [Planktomarina temperata]